jgi:hypothetical protein
LSLNYYLICAFVLYELNKTLKCIIPFLYHHAPILVENSLVVLCLVDITLVEVEW